MRKAVLLRVGIDSGCGGIQGPLFDDKSFEFVCIPDNIGVSKQTYGTISSKNGLSHSAYFSDRKRLKMESQAVHVDPEFKTFTYGDPTSPKRSLRKLEKGDYLIFYCGLQRWKSTTGWDKSHQPALYIVGYFKVGVPSRYLPVQSVSISVISAETMLSKEARPGGSQKNMSTGRSSMFAA